MSQGDPSLLHIYAQGSWHEEAYIVGNREALETLAQNIEAALRDGRSKRGSYASDGEGYNVVVVLLDKPWRGPEWDTLRLPYTDEPAKRMEGRGPWTL
mgnify:FL=1